MRAFPLQYIAVAEMAKVIKPFLTPGGEAVEVGAREHPPGDRHDGESGKDGAPGGVVRLRGVPGGGDEALQVEGPRPGGDGEEPGEHLRGSRLLRPGGEAGGHQLRPHPAAVLPLGGQRFPQDHGGRGEVDRRAGPHGRGRVAIGSPVPREVREGEGHRRRPREALSEQDRTGLRQEDRVQARGVPAPWAGVVPLANTAGRTAWRERAPRRRPGRRKGRRRFPRSPSTSSRTRPRTP